MNLNRLLLLVVAQICVHSTMTGCRLDSQLLALKLGLSRSHTGVMLSLFALSPVFLALPAGRLVDRMGMHRPMVLAVLAACLGATLPALFPAYAALCLGGVLVGGSAAVAQISLQRYVGRAAANEAQLRLVFSWLAIAPAGANFLGPEIASLILDHAGHIAQDSVSFRLSYALLALLPLCTWLIVRRAPALKLEAATAQQHPVHTWELLTIAPLRRLLLVNWMQAVAWDVHTIVVPYIGHDRNLSATAIGSLQGSFAVAAVFVRMLLPKISQRVPEWRLILIATFGAVAALALYPLAPGFVLMAACSTLLGLSVGAVQPMVLSLLYQVSPPAQQGQAMALRVMLMNVSSFMLPIVTGPMISVISVGGVFWFVASGLAVGSSTVPALKNIARPKPQALQQVSPHP